jgi:hypothetical protein
LGDDGWSFWCGCGAFLNNFVEGLSGRAGWALEGSMPLFATGPTGSFFTFARGLSSSRFSPRGLSTTTKLPIAFTAFVSSFTLALVSFLVLIEKVEGSVSLAVPVGISFWWGLLLSLPQVSKTHLVIIFVVSPFGFVVEVIEMDTLDMFHLGLYERQILSVGSQLRFCLEVFVEALGDELLEGHGPHPFHNG